jgi:hypothetical protein
VDLSSGAAGLDWSVASAFFWAGLHFYFAAPGDPAPYTDLWRDIEKLPRQAVTLYGLFYWVCPNPARGDLFIDAHDPYRPILFVFQRRGGEQFEIHAHMAAAAPLKNKKEDFIRAWFL